VPGRSAGEDPEAPPPSGTPSPGARGPDQAEPGLGDGLPVRRHHVRKEDQDPERDRRVHPGGPGRSGRSSPHGQGHRGRARADRQGAGSTDSHPLRHSSSVSFFGSLDRPAGGVRDRGEPAPAHRRWVTDRSAACDSLPVDHEVGGKAAGVVRPVGNPVTGQLFPSGSLLANVRCDSSPLGGRCRGV
jgi:hypothetical protein